MKEKGSHKRVPSIDFQKLNANKDHGSEDRKISYNEASGEASNEAGRSGMNPTNLSPDLLSVVNEQRIQYTSAESLRNNAIGEGNKST